MGGGHGGPLIAVVATVSHGRANPDTRRRHLRLDGQGSQSAAGRRAVAGKNCYRQAGVPGINGANSEGIDKGIVGKCRPADRKLRIIISCGTNHRHSGSLQGIDGQLNRGRTAPAVRQVAPTVVDGVGDIAGGGWITVGVKSPLQGGSGVGANLARNGWRGHPSAIRSHADGVICVAIEAHNGARHMGTVVVAVVEAVNHTKPSILFSLIHPHPGTSKRRVDGVCAGVNDQGFAPVACVAHGPELVGFDHRQAGLVAACPVDHRERTGHRAGIGEFIPRSQLNHRQGRVSAQFLKNSCPGSAANGIGDPKRLDRSLLHLRAGCQGCQNRALGRGRHLLKQRNQLGTALGHRKPLSFVGSTQGNDINLLLKQKKHIKGPLLPPGNPGAQAGTNNGRGLTGNRAREGQRQERKCHSANKTAHEIRNRRGERNLGLR